MSINSLLTGGIRFDDSEEYLEFRFLMLNAVMLTGILFTAIFIAVDMLGLNSLGEGQLLATEINCAMTVFLVLLLRGRKHLYRLVSALFVVVNYATFLSALVLVANDELRVIWFFVELVMVYILIGLRTGVVMTLVTMASILLINSHLPIPLSRNALTTLLIALSATSVISFAYTRRAISYFERMRQSKVELQEMAEKDPLTGLLNPRAYYAVANRMIWLAHRTLTPYAVLFIDLDHFKRINDDFGHESGDAVLRSVARALAAYMRHSDIIGRIGGEEFSVFLPDTTLEAAARLGEKLRLAVQSMDIVVIGHTLSVTASIGVAADQAEDQSIADVQRRADRAMYRAKHGGRNRVESDAGDPTRTEAAICSTE